MPAAPLPVELYSAERPKSLLTSQFSVHDQLQHSELQNQQFRRKIIEKPLPRLAGTIFDSSSSPSPLPQGWGGGEKKHIRKTEISYRSFGRKR